VEKSSFQSEMRSFSRNASIAPPNRVCAPRSSKEVGGRCIAGGKQIAGAIEGQTGDAVHARAADENGIDGVRIAGPDARDEAVLLTARPKLRGARAGKVVRHGDAADEHIPIPVDRQTGRRVVLSAAQQRRVNNLSLGIEAEQEHVAIRTAEAPLHGIGGGREVGGSSRTEDVDHTVRPKRDVARGIPGASSGARRPLQSAGARFDFDDHGIHGVARSGRGLGRQSREIGRVGVTCHVYVASAVQCDPIAIVGGAPKVRHESGFRRSGGSGHKKR
jgi:hypothetical protein